MSNKNVLIFHIPNLRFPYDAFGRFPFLYFFNSNITTSPFGTARVLSVMRIFSRIVLSFKLIFASRA